MMAAVAEAVERFGGLDVAVANAGHRPVDRSRPCAGDRRPRNGSGSSRSTCSASGARCRAALPQIVERRGQIVVISSVYAFANGILNSPYAVAKAGVESLGRALRAELAPHGASASVAYFGWVDTEAGPGRLRPQDDAGRSCEENRRASC